MGYTKSHLQNMAYTICYESRASADGFPFSPAGDVNFIPLHNHYFHFSPECTEMKLNV